MIPDSFYWSLHYYEIKRFAFEAVRLKVYHGITKVNPLPKELEAVGLFGDVISKKDWLQSPLDWPSFHYLCGLSV